jgi:uncharacterized phiE125 gp8 family phage protein
MWDVRTTSVTGAEPVTKEQVKEQCRIDDSDEDGLIDRYIKAAREKVENITGLLLREQEVEITFTDGFPTRLPRAPLTEITALSYPDSASSTVEFEDFELFTQFDVPMLRPSLAVSSWPQAYPGGHITVAAVGGYDVDDVPEQLRQAIIVLVAHWFKERGATAEVPDAVFHLCNDYRLNRL